MSLHKNTLHREGAAQGAPAEDPIDFVLLWVDDSDPEWRALRNQYAPKKDFLIDEGEARYRDWGTLKYWFRSVEKFAHWVNKI